MPVRNVLSNVQVSTTITTGSVRLTEARAEAEFSITILAPSDPAGRITAQIEVSPDGTPPWEAVHRLEGPVGGIDPRDGLPFEYTWSGGVTPEMVGKRIRLAVTSIIGVWTVVTATINT